MVWQTPLLSAVPSGVLDMTADFAPLLVGMVTADRTRSLPSSRTTRANCGGRYAGSDGEGEIRPRIG